MADEKNCEDCKRAAARANSDATTAGFFQPYCSRHAPSVLKCPNCAAAAGPCPICGAGHYCKNCKRCFGYKGIFTMPAAVRPALKGVLMR